MVCMFIHVHNKLTYYILCNNVREVTSKMTDEGCKFTNSQRDEHFYYIMLAKVAIDLYTVYIVLYYTIRNSVNHL